MAIMELETFPITIKEASRLWDKTKRQVLWAVWRDTVKARQCSFSDSWILDFNSCQSLWGVPADEKLVAELREDWHGRA
jgi:hypothetical protein